MENMTNPLRQIIETMMKEHDLILGFLDELESVNNALQSTDSLTEADSGISAVNKIASQLLDAEPHHQREEQVLFPELEKIGIVGPPSVMRSEHEILRAYKHTLHELVESIREENFDRVKDELNAATEDIVNILRDHISKENDILYPMAVQALQNPEVWETMKQRCDEIGYCSFTPGH